MSNKEEFKIKLTSLINEMSIDNIFDLPDFIIANFIVDCMEALNNVELLNDQHRYKNPRKFLEQ